MGAYALITIVVIVLLFLFSAIKVLNEYERAVVFRLGRVLSAPKGPGLIIIIPVVDRFIRPVCGRSFKMFLPRMITGTT